VENADRIIVLSQGQLLLDGTPREICMHPDVLDQVGVRMPQVTEFTISLLARLGSTAQGIALPLTVEDAARIYRTLVQQEQTIS
jgi:hypothetical protein